MSDKIIIIDFNRTIFDPETDKLMPGALELLYFLKSKKMIVYLLSHAKSESVAQRSNLIESLGIKDFFEKIFIKDGKSLEDFQLIMSFHKNLDRQSSWVIGDRVKKEIVLANQCGFKTIWFRNGKFATEVPTSIGEEPDFTIDNLEQILTFIG